MTFEHSDLRIVDLQRSQVRIVLPQFGAGGLDIGNELLWIAPVEVSDRRG
jgi:hypothetical protein